MRVAGIENKSYFSMGSRVFNQRAARKTCYESFGRVMKKIQSNVVISFPQELWAISRPVHLAANACFTLTGAAFKVARSRPRGAAMGQKVRVTKDRRASEGSAPPDIPKLLNELQKLRERVLAAETAYSDKRRGRALRGSMRK